MRRKVFKNQVVNQAVKLGNDEKMKLKKIMYGYLITK